MASGKIFRLVALLIIAGICFNGTTTSNGFIYKPALGARGATEQGLFDAGLDRIDTRLGKEIWLGDPNYGSTLSATVTAIGANQRILRVPAGTHSVAANLTIPANVTLKPERGATLSIDTTKTLTINGSLDAGPYQIFSCTGTGKVVLGAGVVKEVYPQWWGWASAASGATNTAALNAAVLAVNGKNEIVLPAGTYSVNAFDPMPQGTSIRGISGRHSTSYAFTGTELTYAGDGSLFLCQNGSGQRIRDLFINMTGTDGVAIEIGTNSGDGEISKVRINYPAAGVTATAIGIRFNVGTGGSQYWTIKENQVYRAYYGIKWETATGGGNAARITGNRIGNCVYGIYGGGPEANFIAFNCIENCTKTHLYIDTLNSIIIGNHFENPTAWDAFNTPADLTTKNPIVMGANSDRNTIIGNDIVPFVSGTDYANLGQRNYYLNSSAGIQAGTYTHKANITYKGTTPGNIPVKLMPDTAQTADLLQALKRDQTTVAWGITKFGNPYSPRITMASVAGVVTLDMEKGNYFVTTLSENITSVIFANGVSGDRLTWEIIQPAASAYTFPAIANWTDGTNITYMPGGAAPATITATNRHILVFNYIGTRWVEVSRNLDLRGAP